MIPRSNLSYAIYQAREYLRAHGQRVEVPRWQGIDVSDNPELATYEALHYSFSARIPPTLEELRTQVKPNLPWADDHFEERVGRDPLNPGEQYKNWPHYKNDQFRTEDQKFTHTYMERFWPKYAGDGPVHLNQGIRYPYGDLDDVVDLLRRDPLTRQAYFPVWFPEDTGAVHGGRVPCTIGYHFLLRDDRLHLIYHIRSCDLFRHFRDDVYLASRLVLWMIDRLRLVGEEFWKQVQPGDLTMHITSLHIFYGELNVLMKRSLD